uniref:Uncharacterized protein n=1 Tax=Lygus hesperus TaxID=30085 RepID=A0A146LUA2_LYGHE
MLVHQKYAMLLLTLLVPFWSFVASVRFHQDIRPEVKWELHRQELKNNREGQGISALPKPPKYTTPHYPGLKRNNGERELFTAQPTPPTRYTTPRYPGPKRENRE